MGGRTFEDLFAFTLNALYLNVTLNDDSAGDMVTVPNHFILVNRCSLHRYMIYDPRLVKLSYIQRDGISFQTGLFGNFRGVCLCFLCDCLTSKATKTIIQASQFLKDRRVVNEWLGKSRELKRTCVPFSSA